MEPNICAVCEYDMTKHLSIGKSHDLRQELFMCPAEAENGTVVFEWLST